MSLGTIPFVIRKYSGDREYYFGTITSDKVKGVTFVPVIENTPNSPLIERTEDGYQRPGSPPRMNKFKNYLEDNPNSLVPPVLMSGRGAWKFTSISDEFPDYGSIEIEDCAAILDGQHRIGGFVQLYTKNDDIRNIDFILLANLSLEDEVREFVTVNNTQVGVPKSLSAYLGIDIGAELANEAWIAWSMNEREDSPFQGVITRTKMKPEHLLQLASVQKNIDRTFKHGAFGDDVEREEKLEIAIKYWNLIAEYHSSIWEDIEKLGVQGQGRKKFRYKLLELTGFIAWSLIADDILAPAYNSITHTVDWDRVEKSIDTLSDKVDWEKEGQFEGQTGEVGGRKICKEMQGILAQNPI